MSRTKARSRSRSPKRSAPRGPSVFSDLELREYEARGGGSPVVGYEAVETCQACEGSGMAVPSDPDCPECVGSVEDCPTCGAEICVRCGGTGLAEVHRRLRVRVPAGVDDGTQLRVAGEGDVEEAGGPAGDLLLNVRLLPAPLDHRLVRYGALALSLAAIVALVLYLLVH